jgi:hypothetical protein
MKKHTIWSANVNFYISIIFIGVFGLTTTSFLLKFADLDDPITNTLTTTIASE